MILPGSGSTQNLWKKLLHIHGFHRKDFSIKSTKYKKRWLVLDKQNEKMYNHFVNQLVVTGNRWSLSLQTDEHQITRLLLSHLEQDGAQTVFS